MMKILANVFFFCMVKDACISYMQNMKQKLIEMSRECHNQKPQPAVDTKRKTKINACKINKQMHDQLSLPHAM